MNRHIRDTEDVDVVDDESRAEYILSIFQNHYVVIHTRDTAVKLSQKGVVESCMGWLVDGNAGGFLLQQIHEDGTKTHSFFLMEQIGFINDVHIDKKLDMVCKEEHTENTPALEGKTPEISTPPPLHCGT